MKNELARGISLAERKSQYDTQCKLVLSHKIILAWILKYVVREFAQMSISQIEECIGNDVKISQIRVMPGETNAESTEKIVGESNEDKVLGEGDIYFDIRFTAILPNGKEQLKLLINLEAQQDFYPGYMIVTRGVFYGARMISAQKGTEFSGSDYDKIRKVYSIWICMDSPQYIGNAVSEYNIQKSDLIPGIPKQKEAYDKLSVVLICLNHKDAKGNRLTQMLNVLFSSDMEPDEKIKIMEEEYDIAMEVAMEKEVNQVGNLGDYVEKRGIRKGIQLTQIIMIQKKCQKGKVLSKIADEMEEEESAIREIYELVKANPELSGEEILEKLT